MNLSPARTPPESRSRMCEHAAMPIVDVRVVVAENAPLSERIAQHLADAFAHELDAPVGHVWVRVEEIAQRHYAESGVSLSSAELPVFVSVLLYDGLTDDARSVHARRLAVATSDVLGRPVERVHIEYAAPARGRVAFGGRLTT